MVSSNSKGIIDLAMFAVLMFCIFSVPVYPQMVGATLSGTITDQSGAVIPGTKISIKNVATQIVTSTTANGDGLYLAPNLLPGVYDITASAPGFASEIATGITLTVGAQQTANLVMKVGQTTESVQVTGAASAVQLTTSSIGAVVNATTLRELPLNGRSWIDLATLQPDVATVRTEQALASRGQHGFGAEMTINGGRPQQNNFRLNGISINDYSNSSPGSVLGVALGVDAVQEFSVLTANYSAEYGRTSGGVVNAITRSGINSFHGDAYEFLRNDQLDAANFFDNFNNRQTPPFRRNQFGASAGGPIQKDRTFVFGDYEGLRQSLGVTTTDTVPSATARAGNISTGQVTVDPEVARYLQAFYPLPNGALLGNGDTGVFGFSGQQITPENYWTTRLDHKFSEKDSLFGVFLYDSANTNEPDEFNAKRVGVKSGQDVLTLEEDHVFSQRLLNSIRLGYNRSVGADGLVFSLGSNPALSDPSYSFVPGEAVGAIQMPGITAFTGGAHGSGLPQHSFAYNSYQAYDDLVMMQGNHSLKFGANVERIQDNEFFTTEPGEEISFGSLLNFLTNKPLSTRAVINPLTGLTERGTRQTIFGIYFQDDWRWRHNLTLNLGLRYEMATVPTEVQGKISTLLNLTDATPHLGDPYFKNPTLKNFEPRVGFAWDPFSNGKTSVRGGFGVFDVLPLPYILQLLTPFTAPFFLQGNSASLPVGSFPAGIYQFVASNPGLLRAAYVDPNPKRDYVMNGNLNVQRELLQNLTMMVAYVGSRGIHQPWTNNDGNMVIPTLTPQGYLWPSPDTSTQRINPNWGRIAMKLWQSNSFYDALELQLTKRMSHGLQIQGSYTWGKSIDNNSDSEADNSFANTIDNPLWFAPNTNRGPSDFNLGQVFVLSSTWQIPAPKFSSPVSRWILGGWEVGGIYQASSGAPFSVWMAGDPLGQKATGTTELPNLLSGPGCQALTNSGNPNQYVKPQCFAFPVPHNLFGNEGRNRLTGPGFSNLDFSLSKNNYVKRISESFNVQFRAEVFNILNRANFAAPTDNQTAFNSNGTRVGSFGLIDLTQTPARTIQLALKLIW